MPDEQEYTITIYRDGVHFESPMRGKKRYLAEKEFLNKLTGVVYPPNAPPRPVPDPTTDYYELTASQLDSYSAFRHKLRREGM